MNIKKFEQTLHLEVECLNQRYSPQDKQYGYIQESENEWKRMMKRRGIKSSLRLLRPSKVPETILVREL